MSFGDYPPYVPVAKRRADALKAAHKARKNGIHYTPIEPYRGAVAKSFWGKAWCSNLERYSDYANRLPRGRTYVRNGSVIDLQLGAGEVQAKVMGSQLYDVSVSISELPATHWKAVCADCSSSVASLIELLQGKLSNSVMERVCVPGTGLFPAPKELKFKCSCPDWAGMCKHIAAVLYGVGARLDQQPELLFTLRRVDAKDLVLQASVAKPKGAGASKSKKVMADADLAAVFGLEIDDGKAESPKPTKTKKPPAKTPPAAKAKKPVVRNAPAKVASKAVAKKASSALLEKRSAR
jgi:uncharacterized Zn finger protein